MRAVQPGQARRSSASPTIQRPTPYCAPSVTQRAAELKSVDDERTATGIETRRLMRAASKAALATRHHETGTPYVSLVTVATAWDASPILLLSQLAVHTRNLRADPSASLLFDGTDDVGDPLAGGRATVMGIIVQAREAERGTVSRRFLARHPQAQGYAGFADFDFYILQMQSAHFIGGFGRIVGLPAQAVCLQAGPIDLAAWDNGGAMSGLIDRLNNEDRELVRAAVASKRGDGAAMPSDSFLVTEADPDGLTLRDEGAQAGRLIRLDFAPPLASPSQVHYALQALAEAGTDLP